MPDTFTDEDLGIGTLLTDEDVGLGEEAPPSLLDRIKQGALAGGFGALSKDPAKLALKQVAHSVTGPEQAAAMDTIKQAILSTVPGQTRSFQERLGEMPARPPTTAEQIAAGVQNVAAEQLTSPLALAFPVAGKYLSPAVAKSVAALFALQAGMQVPEAARRAGEASVAGTPFEKTVAYGNLGATLALPPLAALDVVRGRAQPESEVTDASRIEKAAEALPSGLPHTATGAEFLSGSVPLEESFAASHTDLSSRGVPFSPADLLSDAASNKSVENVGRTSAKTLSDILEPVSRLQEDNRTADIETKRSVMSEMIQAAHDREVAKTIIRLVPIDVMHDLVGPEFTTKMLLDDPSVLQSALAAGMDKPIATRFLDSLTHKQQFTLKGKDYASKIREAKALYGAVRPFAGEGVREVPVEEGGERIQSQAEKGVQEGPTVSEVQRDVAADVPPEALEHPVQVEAPDGTRRTAFFNGYYELPGMEPLISVGYKLPDGHLSHGMVKPGEKVIGKIPTLEEWKQSKIEEIELEPVIKSGEVMLPARSHAAALEKATGTGNTEIILKALSGERGFRDKKTGRFYNRKEAAEIFKQQGGDISKMIKPQEGLHSEDLQYLPGKEQAAPEPEAKNVPRGTELIPVSGPGAASPADIGTASQITQLTQSIQNTASSKQPIGQRIQAAVKTAVGAVKAAPQTTAQAIKTGVQKLTAVTGAIKSGLTQLPVFTEFKRILGKWDGADQQAAHETRAFVQEINRRIPKDRQEAITNWIQAGGDSAVLQQRAAASTNAKLRKGYEDALTLNADEKVAAQNISNYLDSKLQEGLASGLLDHGLENYINQVWKKPNPVTLKLQADLVAGKLQPNFKFARQRVFDHYFEGEQLGYVPANKSVGALIGIYDQAFNRALSARAFIKNLTEGKAGDGRPLVATSGSAGLVPKGQPPEALLVRPKTKPEDTADYKVVDHPALRKWMWQTQTPEGTPVFVQGDLLVHPEIYQHLKNVLGKSAWRQNKLGRAVLGTEATIKQSMFSASGFHQVQETLHALGHRVNPMNLSDIDFNNPVHKEAVEHGLQLASYDAMEQFTDGLGSGPLINKVPVIGKRLLGPYTEWLFQDYIPRLKITMYEHALGRNAERYQDQIASGKMTKDQLLELTAKQANAAFGEQNYNWIGRNKTMQDALRVFLVAPDFLEARAKFVGQALRPHGREQLVALGLLAATQYITARILNKAIDDEYHWDKPFSLVARKHEYELRTIPGDIAHLIKDPKKFATSRLAPIARQGVEFVTGRDYRGVKRDTLDQIKDFAKLPTPISMRRQDDQRWWETFLNAFGIHERSATASQEIADKARQFREKVKGKATVEILEGNESPYRKLRVSLDVGNEKAALQALRELRQTHPDSRILSTMQSHIRHPFTGSAALEHKFKQSLEPVERKKYQEAMVERKERYQKFKQLWAKRGQKPSAQAALKEPEALTDKDVGL